jgi:hypothetical protein
MAWTLNQKPVGRGGRRNDSAGRAQGEPEPSITSMIRVNTSAGPVYSETQQELLSKHPKCHEVRRLLRWESCPGSF